MTPSEASDRLQFHTEPEEGSFLQMLRPYRGIRDEVLTDVMHCLRACAPMVGANQLPRDLVRAVWAISRLGRSWALHPDGMLRRNDLIAPADQKRLWDFLEDFDSAVMLLLEGVSPHDAGLASDNPKGDAIE